MKTGEWIPEYKSRFLNTWDVALKDNGCAMAIAKVQSYVYGNARILIHICMKSVKAPI